MKLSLIKQIFNVDKYILAFSPSKLIIIGFYEVMKCYSETSPLPCFSSFVNDENSIIFLTPSPPIVLFSLFIQFFLDVFPKETKISGSNYFEVPVIKENATIVVLWQDANITAEHSVESLDGGITRKEICSGSDVNLCLTCKNMDIFSVE